MTREAARSWWDENVELGALDQLENTDDGTEEMIVFLTHRDLIVIHEALKREFVAKKSSRFFALHAVYNVRRAMREAMSS